MTKPMTAKKWHRTKQSRYVWAADVYKFADAYAAYRVREALEENEAEVKALREALGKMQGYARHKGGCAMMRPLRVDEQIPECDCGFSTLYRAAILAAAEEATR